MSLVTITGGSFDLFYKETDAQPAISYLPVNIRLGQQIFCEASQTVWICTSNSDQSNLVWAEIGFTS